LSPDWPGPDAIGGLEPHWDRPFGVKKIRVIPEVSQNTLSLIGASLK
jgi:hypothetical protein